MNMFDILREAQGGNGIDNLARRFGLGREETEKVLRQVLPAMSAGFKQRTRSEDGLEAMLRRIQGTDYEEVYENEQALRDEATRARGNDVLAEVFGSKDVSREVAQRAEFASGIGSTVIKAMLPMIASMVLGGMQRKTSRDSGMGGILGTLINGMGGGSRGRSPDGSGGGLDDLLGAVLGGGGGGSRQTQAPSGGGGLGGVLGGLFGGKEERAPEPRSGGGGGGLDDLLGGILGTRPRQRASTGDRNLDNVIGMFDSDGDGTVDMDVLRQLSRRRR